MVGEGVLHVCLQSTEIAEVLIVNRKASGVTHPKLKEIVHEDFMNLGPIAPDMSGYDACFFCLGVTSVGKNEETYFRLTHELTLHFARTVLGYNPAMTFCYISGAGTDSSEKGRLMWARVKGKTENDLFDLPFRAVYALRPGVIQPIAGMKHTHGFYKALGWILPIARKLSPNSICTLRELANCMIKLARSGYEKRIIERRDIISLGRG